MKRNSSFAVSFLTVACLAWSSSAMSQDANIVLLDESNGVELWAEYLEPPREGFLAADIILRSPPDTRIVTFTELALEGDLVQTTIAGPTADPPGACATPGTLYHEAWLPFDACMTISRDMIGGGAGAAFDGILASNDGSLDLNLPTISGFPAFSGIGSIKMEEPSDAFFLKPEFQSNEIHLAYVVTLDEPDRQATLTLSVLGSGIIDADVATGCDWWCPPMFEAVPLFVPEPTFVWPWLLFGGLLARLRKSRRTS